MVYVEGEWGMCPAPTRRMTKVRLSNDSPQQVVIRRITPEYQYLWFRFYCPSIFPGGNLRAHVHNAFGDSGSVDYRRWQRRHGNEPSRPGRVQAPRECHAHNAAIVWYLSRRELRGHFIEGWMRGNWVVVVVQFLSVEFILTYLHDLQYHSEIPPPHI
jgi:hypothetical protein